MYASCYVLTKIQNLPAVTPDDARTRARVGSIDLEDLEI